MDIMGHPVGHPERPAIEKLGENHGSHGYRKWLAGALGFEPRYVGTKNRCLTTWRRPNRAAVFSEGWGGVQEGVSGFSA